MDNPKNEKKAFIEDTLSNLILCEPITEKGIAALSNLGLSSEEINIDYFYQNLRVPSKYSDNRAYQRKETSEESKYLYFQYTVDGIQFEQLKARLRRFDDGFSSDAPNEYPLLLIGVAGNGKTIEIFRRINEIRKRGAKCQTVYIDLENAISELIYGEQYRIPVRNTLWLFCIKLLNAIMVYIKENHQLCTVIAENYNNILKKKNITSANISRLFLKIAQYSLEDTNSEKELFLTLIGFLSKNDARVNIEVLLKYLMLIIYCADPDKKHYIVFDNIEQYVKLNHAKIHIPNKAITQLYASVNSVVSTIVEAYNRIGKDLGWSAFKIIIALRRTSLGVLDANLLHSASRIERCMTDYTGHIQIPDIWTAKKKYLWIPYLKDEYDEKEASAIIRIADEVLLDGENAVGTDYQSIIAPLMSYGIRRNALSQAHSIFETYRMLQNRVDTIIDMSQFNQLMKAESKSNQSIRYMFRRSLLEFQFKWEISIPKRTRWKNLNIGYLSGITSTDGNITTERVSYLDNNNVTLMRRILSFLSHFPDQPSQQHTVVDMFSTCSLFDLIKGVLVNPRGIENTSKESFMILARVLMALADMSFEETKSAPFIILNVEDRRFHHAPQEIEFSELLQKIWSAGKKEGPEGRSDANMKNSVRITEAGYTFLLDWQPSYSFFAALYCFTVPPLFFLKDQTSISYVLRTVYRAAKEVTDKYETEATRFCGEMISLKNGTYLPRHNEQPVTFKQRVKDLHLNHLSEYYDFIKKNSEILGMTSEEVSAICEEIDDTMKKYRSWNTEREGEVLECF